MKFKKKTGTEIIIYLTDAFMNVIDQSCLDSFQIINLGKTPMLPNKNNNIVASFLHSFLHPKNQNHLTSVN